MRLTFRQVFQSVITIPITQSKRRRRWRRRWRRRQTRSNKRPSISRQSHRRRHPKRCKHNGTTWNLFSWRCFFWTEWRQQQGTVVAFSPFRLFCLPQLKQTVFTESKLSKWNLNYFLSESFSASERNENLLFFFHSLSLSYSLFSSLSRYRSIILGVIRTNRFEFLFSKCSTDKYGATGNGHGPTAISERFSSFMWLYEMHEMDFEFRY